MPAHADVQSSLVWNPRYHSGIFDFVRRDPKTYLPDFSLNRYEQNNAFTPPRAVNLRHGVPV